MNTMLIIADQGSDSNSYAAGLCANLVNHNTDTDVVYGDWYLPSIYELDLMHENIGPGTETAGGFASAPYWSSTEADGTVADDQLAAVWAPDTPGQLFVNKVITYRVRAVRAF